MGKEILSTDRLTMDFPHWLETPAGQYLLDWESAQFDRAVADIFGFHALQLGLPELDALQANRMPHRWLACDETQLSRAPRDAALFTDFSALPFAAASLDLVLLPHALELHTDPHATLREVERVLLPEGRVVISGFNPIGLWAMRQRRARLTQRLGFGERFQPDVGHWIGYRRMRDWLRLLGFEVEQHQFGCYRPALHGQEWLERCAWMDRVGARWWPILGSAYFIVAVKRVRGMRLLEARWKVPSKVATTPASIANRVSTGQPPSFKKIESESSL
jgi:SAM-dependent methyltransferase